MSTVNVQISQTHRTPWTSEITLDNSFMLSLSINVSQTHPHPLEKVEEQFFPKSEKAVVNLSKAGGAAPFPLISPPVASLLKISIQIQKKTSYRRCLFEKKIV